MSISSNVTERLYLRHHKHNSIKVTNRKTAHICLHARLPRLHLPNNWQRLSRRATNSRLYFETLAQTPRARRTMLFIVPAINSRMSIMKESKASREFLDVSYVFTCVLSMSVPPKVLKLWLFPSDVSHLFFIYVAGWEFSRFRSYGRVGRVPTRPVEVAFRITSEVERDERGKLAPRDSERDRMGDGGEVTGWDCRPMRWMASLEAYFPMHLRSGSVRSSRIHWCRCVRRWWVSPLGIVKFG